MRVLQLPAGGESIGPTVVCLGFFDGVHIGHARLIERAREIANASAREILTCVHTFDSMPSRILQPEADIPELTPLPHKAALMEALGVDILAVSNFRLTMSMRADEFVTDVLMAQLHAVHIVVGFHHHFGFHGEGDVTRLDQLCRQHGIGLDIIPPVTLDNGELVSSSAIRVAISCGNIEKAQRMLGRETL